MKVVTAEEMASLEKEAVSKGITVAGMMEKAGHAVARVILALKPTPKTVLVLVGPGNNGGDGLVAAYYLLKAGVKVTAYLWKRQTESDPLVDRLVQEGTTLVFAQEDEDLKNLQSLLKEAEIVVDALLGTGFRPPVKRDLELILRTLAQEREKRFDPPAKVSIRSVRALPSTAKHRPFIVAVDIPTGVNGTTGESDPAAVPADITVTFGFPKRGHFLFPGAELTGELLVADIGIPQELASGIRVELVTPELVQKWLPPRPKGSHKGTFGKVLIIAGSTNYTGAPCLAGLGAMRVGAGLVTMAIPSSIHPIVASKLTETTFLLLPSDMGAIVPDALEVLSESWPSYQAILLGPGLGRDKQTVEFVHQLIRGKWEKRKMGFLGSQETPLPPLPPMVIDADGLNALADLPLWWEELKGLNVLTPHPGEMSRLCGLSTEEINRRRIDLALEKAQEWGQVIVLKGAYTCIASPEGLVYINPFANPAMATAGSGDVLAGAIAGFIAQGLEPIKAAVVGTYVHSLAGEMVKEELGEAGPTAGDLPGKLPLAIRKLRGGKA
ncbi:MAG: NAD(P)H-hydrate dehydratase [Anaerolineae bacterium]|nr:NAD(P)H-hydrate dehydratase [Anaerolineae bacterium]MDW8101751.1 NAD(P)H-hydrate dehydratase [Anaerolineae bacterium]